MVKIQLVDYGSNYYTSYKNLRNLFPSVQHYPRLAQLCYLQNVSFLAFDKKPLEIFVFS